MARKRTFRIGRSRTGLGLFATAPIKKGAFIVEYKGRKLTNEQADKLEARIIRALKNIRPGVEITYNYGRDYLTNVITRRGCKCDKCRKKRANARVKACTKGR